MNTEMDFSEENNKSPLAKIIISVVVILLIVLAVIFFLVANRYQKVFLRNTYINGVNVSGLTPEEANDIISNQQKTYYLDIKFKDGNTETIKAADIGYGYTALSGLNELLEDQIPSSWIKRVLPGSKAHENDVKLMFYYDEDLLREVIKGFSELKETAMTKPVDAYVTLDDVEFKIVPEVEGNYIDSEKVFTAAKEKIDNVETELILADTDAYVEPKVRENDKTVIKERDDLNKMISGSVTYLLYDTTKTIDKTYLASWMSKDSDGHYYKDETLWESKLQQFVGQLADIVDYEPVTWEFDATGGGTYKIEGGTYARKLDLEGEYKLLKEELDEGLTVERMPVVGDEKNHGIGDTYVEIDLSRQHLWAYDHGECWMSTDIVSGKATHDRYTPEGVYYVYYKTEKAVLRGALLPNGAYEYEAPVDYWMPFNGDIGMHDADWQYYFGGEQYLWGGSRGCINMPVDQAPLMYDWIESNIPVVCYYSQPIIWID